MPGRERFKAVHDLGYDAHTGIIYRNDIGDPKVRVVSPFSDWISIPASEGRMKFHIVRHIASVAKLLLYENLSQYALGEIFTEHNKSLKTGSVGG